MRDKRNAASDRDRDRDPSEAVRGDGSGRAGTVTVPDSTGNLSRIAHEQIRPDDEAYLNDIDEFRRAVDIGRRVLKRSREGGRPSKVEAAVDRVETILEWYGGEQRHLFLSHELAEIRASMSRPTWQKFVDRAEEVVAAELGDGIDLDDLARSDRG